MGAGDEPKVRVEMMHRMTACVSENRQPHPERGEIFCPVNRVPQRTGGQKKRGTQKTTRIPGDQVRGARKHPFVGPADDLAGHLFNTFSLYVLAPTTVIRVHSCIRPLPEQLGNLVDLERVPVYMRSDVRDFHFARDYKNCPSAGQGQRIVLFDGGTPPPARREGLNAHQPMRGAM